MVRASLTPTLEVQSDPVRTWATGKAGRAFWLERGSARPTSREPRPGSYSKPARDPSCQKTGSQSLPRQADGLSISPGNGSIINLPSEVSTVWTTSRPSLFDSKSTEGRRLSCSLRTSTVGKKEWADISPTRGRASSKRCRRAPLDKRHEHGPRTTPRHRARRQWSDDRSPYSVLPSFFSSSFSFRSFSTASSMALFRTSL